MVVGDLHGNLLAFNKVLKLAALDRHPGRHLVLQELIHGPLMYPDDKGDRSHQLLDVFAALKCQYPEPSPPDPGQSRAFRADRPIIGKDGEGLNAKFRRGIETAYGGRAGEIYRGLQGAFRRSAPGGADAQSRLRLPHVPDAIDLDTLDLDLLEADSGRTRP